MNLGGMLPSPWHVDACVWRVVFPCVCQSRSHFCGWCLSVFKTWHVGMCLLLVLAWVCTSHVPVCAFRCMRMHKSVAVRVFVFSLISSEPAGQFWHLERKTLCVPPRLLCFQLWIRDRAMICGSDFINATNLSFPPSLPFSLFLCVSLSPRPPSWVGESALLCALNER